MVGDNHTHTELARCRDAVNAGNTVIHCYQNVRLVLRRDAYDLRGQAISVLESVGHQVVDFFEPHLLEQRHRQRTAGCTIGIKVPDNNNARLKLDRISEHLSRFLSTLKGRWRQ